MGKGVKMWCVKDEKGKINLAFPADCESDAWIMAGRYCSYYPHLDLEEAIRTLKDEGCVVVPIRVSLVEEG